MLRLTVAILIILCASLIVGADAKMYIVDDDGFAQYHSINEAVTIANDGDTIYVKPGTYREHIVLNKSLIIMPPRGEDEAVNLSGDGSDIGIEVLADGCKIEGITISDFAGPGIYVESKDNETRKNVFLDNVHGIFLNGTSGNTLEMNQERGGYCGIVLLASRENTIRGNVAEGSLLAGMLLNTSSKNTIEGSKAEGCARGIYLITDSQENEMEGNSMIDCGYGVLLEKSSMANMIRRCNFENASTAIALNSVSKNLVQNNSVSNSTNGIALFSSTENSIVENSLVRLGTGIMVSESSVGNILTKNKIEESGSGIVVTDSSANKLEGNVMMAARWGLYVDGSTEESFDNQIPESNQINGEPILYLYGRSNEEISGRNFGHLTLAFCENCTVLDSSVTNDALFVHSSRGCRIQDNVVSNCYGMRLQASDDNEIVGNQACDNRYSGILLVESNGNLIGENTLCRNERDGLSLVESDSNMVQMNTAEANKDTGIRLLSSNETEITGNSVIGNGVGIGLNESAGCIVYRNNLIENEVQAKDDGGNLWDWGVLKGGNYWSDHSCQGNPCHGQPKWIGETTADYYPFGERDGWI